jgi:hypothetical protein
MMRIVDAWSWNEASALVAKQMDFAAAVGSSPVARALEVAQFLLQENVSCLSVLRVL